MSIQAIETEYRGVRFRSRLEARWAVYFDVTKIPWEYEVQGYSVNGRSYLPDFVLGENRSEQWPEAFKVWVEVKGDPEELDPAFLSEFSEETQRPVLVLGSIPESFGNIEHVWRMITGIGSFQQIALGNWHRNHRVWYAPREMRFPNALDRGEWLTPGLTHDSDTENSYWATKCARSARFEHGEEPTVFSNGMYRIHQRRDKARGLSW